MPEIRCFLLRRAANTGPETSWRKTAPSRRTSALIAYNYALSRFRVRVEHAFAKLKAFRLLSARYRYPRPAYAAKFAIIAGIVNLAAGF